MGGMTGGRNPQPVRPIKNQDAHNAAQIIDMFFPGQVVMWQALISLMMVLLGWYAVTVEVFFRYKFGERYFNLVKIGIATLIMGGVIQVGQYLSGFAANYVSIPTVLFSFALLTGLWWLYLGFTIWHYIAIWLRNQRGETWHSQSYGLSHLYRIPFFQQFDDWLIYRIIEPAICLALAFVMWFINRPLGVWLGIAGIALFARNNLAYMQQRDTMLDLLDERIHSRYLADALSGTSKAQTAGWSVAKVPSTLFHEVQAVAEAAAADPPDFTSQIAERLRTTPPSAAAAIDTLEATEAPAPAQADDGPRFTAYEPVREPESQGQPANDNEATEDVSTLDRA